MDSSAVMQVLIIVYDTIKLFELDGIMIAGLIFVLVGIAIRMISRG